MPKQPGTCFHSQLQSTSSTLVGEDVLVAPPGLLLIVNWLNIIQVVGRSPVLPIPDVKDHLSEPLADNKELLTPSPTTYPNQPLLTMSVTKRPTMIIVPMLVQRLKIILDALNMDTTGYSLQNLRQEGIL